SYSYSFLLFPLAPGTPSPCTHQAPRLQKMTKDERIGNTNTAKMKRFVIWALSFIRHSTFVLRHFMNLV
ncbi:MAG TPA: hypothetical protein VGQ70_01505, partial [Candidatus Udaeobacter sp.]|nr:hypothetical protein [Candidatus Udaeobacter sp.]